MDFNVPVVDSEDYHFSSRHLHAYLVDISYLKESLTSVCHAACPVICDYPSKSNGSTRLLVKYTDTAFWFSKQCESHLVNIGDNFQLESPGSLLRSDRQRHKLSPGEGPEDFPWFTDWGSNFICVHATTGNHMKYFFSFVCVYHFSCACNPIAW